MHIEQVYKQQQQQQQQQQKPINSRIYKTIYQNSSYLLLFRKNNSCE